jgi:cytochrome d ubiquinol oxidase subunit I
MEMTSFKEVLFNPVAQDKFVHTVSAGYVTGSVFVLAVSAIYLLQGRHGEFAKRSMTVAASFGLASALSVVVLGDESGYTAGENQKMKIAAVEAMWNTEPAPASFTLFGLPDTKTRETEYRVQIPWVLGLIATRSLDQQLPGITDLVAEAQTHIRNGIPAYAAIEALHNNPKDEVAKAELASHVSDLGYALLLKRYDPNVVDATDAEIAQAAQDTVPAVATLFWSFRVMVGLGFGFIALFAAAFWLAARRRLDQRRWFLWVSALCLPLPWISCELGWIVAEYGRQPWAIEGVLPTYLANSSVAASDVWFSLTGFIVFYTTLAIVDLYLIVRTIRLGPDVVGDDSGPDRRRSTAQPVQ